MDKRTFSKHEKKVRLDIINELKERHGLTRGEAENIVDTATAYIRAELAAGHDIEIRGLGSLVVRDREARPGRDIREGTTVIIPKHKTIVFRPGAYLKQIYKPDRGEFAATE